MQNMNKIQLILYKNKKKTKNNLVVNGNITYEKFEAKLKQFTRKQFQIQIQTRQKDVFQKLYPSNFKSCLQNYKGEKINIMTFDDSLIASNKSTKNEHSELDKIQFQSLQKQKSNQEAMSSLKKSLQKVQIIQDLKQKQNEGISKHQLSINQFDNMIQTKQELKQRIKPIFKYYENITLQKIYGKNQQKQYKKIRCCQCKRDIVATYYVCLVCPRSIIICSSCQAKDIIEAHNFKGHALGKIKRWTQQITSKASIQSEDHQQMNKLIQQKIEQIIKKKMLGKSKLREP